MSFIVVHCEPEAESQGEHQVLTFPMLVAIMQAADTYGAKVTFALSPQWASFLLVRPRARQLVRSWVANGHELAYHHHGYSNKDTPARWDGYSDMPVAVTDPEYRGTAEDAYNLVSAVLPAVPVASGLMSDAHVDWQPGLTYKAWGGGLISLPTSEVIMGVDVQVLTYAAIQFSVSPAEVEAAIPLLGPDASIGLVLHAYQLPDVMEDMLTMLSSLNAAGMAPVTLSSLLQ